MMRPYLKFGALAVALFCSASLWAQTPTLSCRPMQPGNTYIDPDEKVIGDQICKIVATATQPQKQAAANTQPAPVQATPAPADSTSAPAPEAQATSTDAKPDQTTDSAPAAGKINDGKIRLFVTDEPKDESIFLAAHRSGWQVSGHNGNVSGSGGSAGAAYGYSDKGPDPRTVELEADLYKSCPSIVVTNDPSRGDYVLLFRRQGGKRSQMFIFGGLTGLALSAHSKVDGASVFDKNGDMVYATRERTVGKAIKEVCGHLK